MSVQIPHDRAAEEAVLGSLIINPEMYYQVAAILKPSDFYITRNNWVFEAIGNLHRAHLDIDLITICNEMDKRGEDYGGSAYLTSLVTSMPTSINVVSYARLVAEQATRRGIINHANKAASLAYSSEPIDDVLTQLQASASETTERTGGKRVSAKESASRAIDALLNHPRRFSFGVESMDTKLKGIFPQRLYIWAGYQGSGKSAFKIQNSRVNAELGFKIMDVSLEMSAEQTWIRMACGDLGIDSDSVMAGEVDSDTKSLVINKAAELGEMYQDSIVVYPAPMTLMDILAAAKTEQPDIIWIDHSRLISGRPKDMNAYEWAMYVPTFLRQEVALMKGTSGISVHLLMQLNRSSNKENRRPNMHDLRLGGEDDPDMVTLLYRPDVDPNLPPEYPLGQVKVEMIHDKNRFGWTGTTDVLFDLPYQRFLPLEQRNINQSIPKYSQQKIMEHQYGD